MSQPPPASKTVSLADRDANDRFSICFDRVLGHEGGFNNRAADRGGPTKFGISLRFLRAEVAINGRVRALFPAGPIDINTIRALTREQATKIALWCFWIPVQCDSLKPPIDGMLFDQAFNAGPRTGVILLQRAINAASRRAALLEDGAIGPRTIAAANALDIAPLREAFVAAASARYRAIIGADPGQSKNEGGWLNRAAALGDV